MTYPGRRGSYTANVRMLLAAAALMSALAAKAAGPSLVALLIEPELNAARGEAVVEVRVFGAALADPAKGDHLHVRLDKAPPVATGNSRLAFHGLPPGPHEISVALVDRDDKPLGAKDTVWLVVPAKP